MTDPVIPPEAVEAASRERVAEALAKHYPYTESYGDGYNEPQEEHLWCACTHSADDDGDPLASWVQTGASDNDPDFAAIFAAHLADALIAAGVFRDEADLKLAAETGAKVALDLGRAEALALRCGCAVWPEHTLSQHARKEDS